MLVEIETLPTHPPRPRKASRIGYHHVPPQAIPLRSAPTPSALSAIPARVALGDYLELLFNSLRGESLLIAALAYGLRLPITALRELRIRDVSVADRLIYVAERERPIPSAIIEDLREHLHENVCGRDATIGVTRRHELLFSSQAFTQLEVALKKIEILLVERLGTLIHQRAFSSFNTRLRVLGSLHARRIRSLGRCSSCPLDSIDKGPRIVRRGRGGVIDAYYRWRVGRM